jgi:uncharacterized RDD family membrane protein YckC
MTNPYAPPLAAVRDIVDPLASAAPAGRGTRLGAVILDGIIFGVLVYMPLVVGVMIGAAAGRPADDGVNASLVIGSVLALAGLIVWSWFTIIYVKRNGQSIAKKLLGIKVVRTDNSPISLGRIFWLRNVVNGLISIVPFYGIVDVLFIFGESRQCLHDKIADTIVVSA